MKRYNDGDKNSHGVIMNGLKIYSNQNAIDTLLNMSGSGRLSHSFLFYGESGLGKKTLAKFLSMLILCEDRQNKPCGKCNPCIKILSNSHPDVILAQHYGKRGGFEDRMLKELSLDAYVKPNDGQFKIYIFADSDNISIKGQNILLKIIEEPPPHAKFIFTASGKDIFLPTILSRVTAIPAQPATREQCRTALIDAGITDEGLIDEVINAFGGNIGKCIDAARNEDIMKAVANVKNVCKAIISRNEYALQKALFDALSDRAAAFSTFQMLTLIMRDAILYQSGANSQVMGIDRTLSEQIGGKFTIDVLIAMIDIFKNSSALIDRNMSLPLISAKTTADIFAAL
ncbi:MAG: hypothetical protein GX967_04660 [Clostridiales bacterium]|nr:hypothetical protein [Clostridiales bacterium]